LNVSPINNNKFEFTQKPQYHRLITSVVEALTPQKEKRKKNNNNKLRLKNDFYVKNYVLP